MVACSSSNTASPPADAGPALDDASDGSASGTGDSGALMPVTTSTYDIAKSSAGEYAAQIRFRKIESVGALGSMDAMVTINGTVTIADDAAAQQVTFATRFCHTELTGTGTGLLAGSGLVTPDIVMTTTTLDTVPFSAAMVGGAVRWSVPEVHGPIGWTWTSPSDALPTSASDPRVIDQDDDMNPGVTIDVTLSGTAFPVYVVQTERDTFSGTVDSSGNLQGVVVDATSQNVIGSSNPLLASAALTTQPDANTADNVARFVRVPARLSCSDLAAQAATLFN
jgi:hypothetical protein